MGNIVNWCNENNGFVTAILAFLSLFISVIAVYVSIVTARLPYKKKIKITCDRYFIVPHGEIGINVGAVNIGQMPVHVSMMGLWVAKNQIFQPNKLNECQKLINHAENAQILLTLNGVQKTILEMNLKKNQKIYAYMRDTEGTTYKQYFSTVEKVLSIK